MPEPWQVLLTLLAGFVTGILSGMFGIGGAVASTPAIRALGATPFEGIGSTLPSIVPSAISGSLRYRREGLIIGRVAALTVAFGLAGAVGGALLASAVPGNGHLLMLLTAALLAFTAYRTAAPRELAEEAATNAAADRRDEMWRLGVIGVAAGGLSGLLGIGGGILLVPAFSGWVRLTIKESVATSLACVGALAIPGTITHAFLGHVDWGFAIPLSLAVIPGARVGADLAIRATDRGLRLAVGIVLGTIALVYAIGEIIALG